MNALGNAVKSLIGSGSDRSLDEIATDLACFAA
jgi:hypothetical protein